MSSRPSIHPSAEEFLRQLILFIDSRGSELLSSKDAFKLQPRALEYLALRLEGLRELQRIKTSNPIRFLAGAVADLTDFLRMEKVQQFCTLVRHLKLYSSAQDIRDPTPVNFSPFKSLVTLEIRGCDLSSVCPGGVECIRPTVECIVCQDSLECLWHLLEPLKVRETETSVYQRRWLKLTRLSCIYNDMREMDASLKLATNLITVDFSRNKIVRAQNLHDLPHLTALDLSFNRLRELGDICMAHGLRHLFLQSNAIHTLEGIGALERLEEVDLRWNVISLLSDVAKLKTLSSLRLVSLAGNPISAMPNYRLHVLACLLEWRDDVVLDSKLTTDVEKKRARRMTVSADGHVELNPPESSPTSVPTPSSLWGCFPPFFSKCRRGYRQLSSNYSDVSERVVTEGDLEEAPERPAHRRVKRIVDLPDTSSYAEGLDPKPVEVTDVRMIPRVTLARGQTQARDFGQFNGSYEESRSGIVS